MGFCCRDASPTTWRRRAQVQIRTNCVVRLYRATCSHSESITDEDLYPVNIIGLTSAELDELDRLRHSLGQEAFNRIQQQAFNDYIAVHEPPYNPGIWQALLVALRAAVRH